MPPFVFFSSIIEVFKIFSYCKLITLKQSRNLVSVTFNLAISSFVIKRAIDINRAVLLELIIPAKGFNIANVLKLIFEADPIKTSVLFNSTFFLYKLL